MRRDPVPAEAIPALAFMGCCREGLHGRYADRCSSFNAMSANEATNDPRSSDVDDRAHRAAEEQNECRVLMRSNCPRAGRDPECGYRQGEPARVIAVQARNAPAAGNSRHAENPYE